jgi:tetratricopeptide (TPR) repeat protein
MEAESLDTINFFSDYLYKIPRLYEADCEHCFDCNGVRFNFYRGYSSPTDTNSFEELVNGHIQSKRGRGKWCTHDSDHCESLCWYGGYFRLWNHKDLPFFQHYLQYCSENDDCDCYWPEYDLDAMTINNRVYSLLRGLVDDGVITHAFSTYWQASKIEFDYHGKVYTDLYYPNSHGMASSLTTYTFFYSQYHQMLLSVAEFIDSNSITGNSKALDKLYTTLEELRKEFFTQYKMCIRDHPHPKIYYERGMLRMHSGRTEDALMDINRLMRMANSDRYKDRMILTTEMYQQEGEVYAELGNYDKAISSLTEAIRLDPNNRGAYFSRAQAYFERGEFEQSLNDYLNSKNQDNFFETKLKPSWEIKESLLKGLQEGGKEAALDFVPSLCSSVYGLCSSMWVFAQHPIDSTNQFVNVCYDLGNCINEFRKNVDLEEIESYPLEIQRLYDQYDRLSEPEKGYLIGYIVGKYGVDIFAGGTTIKGIAYFKKLRNANRTCMLDTLKSSKANKEALVASAQRHKAECEAFFKNIKLEWDKQNKHIPGKHNFELGKSELVHTDPEALLSKFSGKGKPIKNKIPGDLDYRERVDFGEFIGYYIDDKKPELKLPTTKGTIRYSKKGAHIVPSHPEVQ